MNEAKCYPQLLGLVELDQVGTVLFSSLEKSSASSDLSERNSFSEVAPAMTSRHSEDWLALSLCGSDQAISRQFHL